jgi:hypothetical protein
MNYLILDSGINQARSQEPLVLIHRDFIAQQRKTTILLGSAMQFSTAREAYNWASVMGGMEDARVVRSDSSALGSFKEAP